MKKLVMLVMTGWAVSAMGANLASDNASNAAYNDGWQSGDNGGTGFGAWVISFTSSSPDRNGAFVGSSANNGDPAPTGDIDIDGESWGLYANQLVGMSGPDIGVATAYRPFTGGELQINQTLTLQMDTGQVDSWMLGPGSVGFSLNRFSFFFASGSSEYSIGYGDPNSTLALQSTGVPLTYDGLDLAFTRTGVDTYDFAITPNGGSTTVISGVMPETGGSLDSITFYNRTAGPGASHDVFFNDLEIVPEPSTIGLGLAGILMLLVRRGKRA